MARRKRGFSSLRRKLSRAFSTAKSRGSRSLTRARRSLNRASRQGSRSLNRLARKTSRRASRVSRVINRKLGLAKRRQVGTTTPPQYRLVTKRGAAIREKVYQSGTKGAPLLGLLINKHRGLAGEKGLYGEEMKAAIEKEWRRRASSIGFLRAGFLAAMADIGKAIGKRVYTSTAKWLKRTKYIGHGVPAKPGTNPIVRFTHAAFGRNTSNPGIVDRVKATIEKATAQELVRMREHMERKLQSDANRFAGRILR